MRRFLLLAFFFFLGFGLGRIALPKDDADKTTGADSPEINRETPTEIRQSGYKFISPLLECAPTSGSEGKLLPFKEKIEAEITRKIEDKEASFISFYYRDLNNGPTLGINKNENFAPASLLKVPLMMAYLKKAEFAPTILFDTIFYDEKQTSLEVNVPQGEQLESGRSYPIIELMERMIVYSDNTSFELLSMNISQAEIEKIHQDIGITVPSKDAPENFITVQEYASFFRVLYNASYLNREMSEKALELLSKTTFQNGIVAGIPKEIITSHKFGIREHETAEEKQLHDCGVVYAPQKPYLICVMTRGNDLEKLSHSIKDISAIVYNNIAK